MMNKEKLYRVIFTQNQQIYEVYVRSVFTSEMPGFIQIEDFVFGENSSDILIDPTEEKLKDEFSGINTCFIPIYSVSRIDEVKRKGSSKVYELKAIPRKQPTP